MSTRLPQVFAAQSSPSPTQRRPPLLQALQRRKHELRMATIFLLLIFVPGALLGYLSWRAIKNEKLLYEQKIVESYSEFARLAAHEIDDELANVQAGLQAFVQKVQENPAPQPYVEKLDSLAKVEPMISSCALLRSPGQVLYPPEMSLPRQKLPIRTEQGEIIAREYERYTDMLKQGEDLEYRGSDINGAIAVYKKLLARVSSPQLQAMAHSVLGRAQTKKGDWPAALQTYTSLLNEYPEERDLNRAYMRFLAQHQIVVCLLNLKRAPEAAEALLRMNQDLLERSDTMTVLQYSQFSDGIRGLQTKVLAANFPEAERYKGRFQTLAASKKKNLSEKYFVYVFDDQLRELIIERKAYRAALRYVSGQTDKRPFLLGYWPLPDVSGQQVSGLLGFRVNLTRLRKRIFPAILSRLKTSDAVNLAILDNNGNYVIGTKRPDAAPVATYALEGPFTFWQVGVFLAKDRLSTPLTNLSTQFWLWLISVLLFSIFFGAYIFFRYARYEAHLSELKSTFVSRVSHELRTPLTSIKMLAEHLAMQTRQKPGAQPEDFRLRMEQYLEVICRESDRLGRLIENVLSFSKIERGVKSYNFEYEVPVEVLHRALASFRPHAEAHGFTLNVKIDETLPELLLDADSITEVMLNLLGNALAFSDKEKIIEVRAFRAHDQVCVEVEDHGIGIALDQTANIFDEFYRIERKPGASSPKGMGLGLTLAKHIAEAHHGTIEVRSEKSKGSTFILRLPVPPEEPPPETLVPDLSSQQKTQPQTRMA